MQGSNQICATKAMHSDNPTGKKCSCVTGNTKKSAANNQEENDEMSNMGVILKLRLNSENKRRISWP
jgi:hypothetical protein